jgi:ribonucleoside-diphosphate reductase alpha subunit
VSEIKPMNSSECNCVIKRDGTRAPFAPEKITVRLKRLKRRVEQFLGRPLAIDVELIAGLARQQLVDGITTSELDDRTADLTNTITDDPDYALFAGNLLMSNLEKNNFQYSPIIAYAKQAYKNVGGPLISEQVYNAFNDHEAAITSALRMDRNWMFDYTSMSTLIRGQYLLNEKREVRLQGKMVAVRVPFETPQHAFLRMSLAVYPECLAKALQLYDRLSQRKISMPTPCWFNLGTPHQSVISCFLFGIEDSLSSIYGQLSEAAAISKGAGGEGIWWHKVRGKGSRIAGTNGDSNGLIPAMKVYQATASYVDQGGGKRAGSFAMYITPWHPDALAVVRSRRNVGTEADQLHLLHTALWIPDLYFERLRQSVQSLEARKTVMWSFFDPSEACQLIELVGAEFTREYERLEQEQRYRFQMPIYEFHDEVMRAQVETGEPYMLAADHCNRKSNQQNLGTIKSSNLCTEIIEYSNPSADEEKNETACCNLCSIVLQTHLSDDQTSFDYKEFEYDVGIAVDMMNQIIDLNMYPTRASQRSNVRHRPVAMGVQGLADVFALLNIPYDSDEAETINRLIFEHMYYAALDRSCTLAERDGPYPSMRINGGSPLSRGVFHFELDPNPKAPVNLSFPDKWEILRARVLAHGTRNSLLIGPMPTASTANIMMSNECFEPFYSMGYVHNTKHAEFQKVNAHMVRALKKLGLWNSDVRDQVLASEGSIQGVAGVPQSVKNVFKTVWEIPLKRLLDMAVSRGHFIDQSQSFNTYFEQGPNLFDRMLLAHLYGYCRGMKTLSYYTRVHEPKNKGVIASAKKRELEERARKVESEEGPVCSLENKEGCAACSG